jgi:predicted transcriptional regulator
MTTKNRVTINLDDDEYRSLQIIAERTDRSLSWLGRKAVCRLLEQERKIIENSTVLQSSDTPVGRTTQ